MSPTRKSNSFGLLYVAFGESFLEEAKYSILSVRQQMPQVDIALFCDEIPEWSERLRVKATHVEPGHLRAKIDFLDQTPFEKTLYLDSDTLVMLDLSEIDQLLNRFEVLVTHDLARKRENVAEKIPEYAAIPYGFPEINGGILAFRFNRNTSDFLQLWKEKFYQYREESNGWDQPALRIALWDSQVATHTLPEEFNVRSKANRKKQRKNRALFGKNHLSPRVIHLHHTRLVHKGIFPVKNLYLLKLLSRFKANVP